MSREGGTIAVEFAIDVLFGTGTVTFTGREEVSEKNIKIFKLNRPLFDVVYLESSNLR
jgi:hypothetical protein